MRWLALIHRYLGIAIGILMAAWCLSGIVMMYVSYPGLTRRVHFLHPLDLRGCCGSLERSLPDDQPVRSFQLEMLAGRPVLRVRAAPPSVIDLRSGSEIATVSPQQAQAVAADFVAVSAADVTPVSTAGVASASAADIAAAGTGVDVAAGIGKREHLRLQQTLDYDQWTLEGIPRDEPPLYRFAANDAAGTEAYVSLRSGRLVQTTTARQRFWNWLGAVPHWLYFARLRRNGPLWTRVVVWTSLAGCLLTATGLYLGVQRFLRRPQGRRWSPYRGLLLWHHVPGFIAGVFALTWVASGLISMNPWGFLESTVQPRESTLVTGREVKQAIAALSHLPLPTDWVSVDSAPLNGHLYLIATTAAGLRTRWDSQGSPSPLRAPEVEQWVRTLTGSEVAPELLSHEDAYYFSHHRNIVVLPAYRAIAPDAEHTRYYIDAVSGSLLSVVDGNTRWYRWLHEGLHRMDFAASLRSRPLWDVVMWVLLCAVTTICCTGAILGIRRLR
jgi:hypothetical protein